MNDSSDGLETTGNSKGKPVADMMVYASMRLYLRG